MATTAVAVTALAEGRRQRSQPGDALTRQWRGHASADWPLSQEEKKKCVLRLYDRDLHAANELVRSGEDALRTLRSELRLIRAAAGGVPGGGVAGGGGGRRSCLLDDPAAAAGKEAPEPLCVGKAAAASLSSPSRGTPRSPRSQLQVDEATERLRLAINAAAATLTALLDGAALAGGRNDEDLELESFDHGGGRPRAHSEGSALAKGDGDARPGALRRDSRRCSRDGRPLRVSFASEDGIDRDVTPKPAGADFKELALAVPASASKEDGRLGGGGDGSEPEPDPGTTEPPEPAERRSSLEAGAWDESVGQDRGAHSQASSRLGDSPPPAVLVGPTRRRSVNEKMCTAAAEARGRNLLHAEDAAPETWRPPFAAVEVGRAAWPGEAEEVFTATAARCAPLRLQETLRPQPQPQPCVELVATSAVAVQSTPALRPQSENTPRLERRQLELARPETGDSGREWRRPSLALVGRAERERRRSFANGEGDGHWRRTFRGGGRGVTLGAPQQRLSTTVLEISDCFGGGGPDAGVAGAGAAGAGAGPRGGGRGGGLVVGRSSSSSSTIGTGWGGGGLSLRSDGALWPRRTASSAASAALPSRSSSSGDARATVRLAAPRPRTLLSLEDASSAGARQPPAPPPAPMTAIDFL